MYSTDEKAFVADINQLSEIEFPSHNHPRSWHRARLYATAGFVALVCSTALDSKAEVVYRIVDSKGTVTYSEHPPASPGNFTVTRINKNTRAVLPDKSIPTEPDAPSPPPEQLPAPPPEQSPAPPPETASPPPAAAPDTVSCSGVVIAAGSTAAQIQAKVDANVADSTFCFAPGIYVLQALVRLKDGVKMICTVRRACVLTGLDKYRGGFNSPSGTSRQQIRGFVAERFLHVEGQWPLSPFKVRDFGVIEDNEIRGNEVGIDIGSRGTIRNNFIHHNRRYGVSGGPGDDMLIESNEVSFNNTSHFDPNDGAGGSKIIGGRESAVNRLTWRRNYVHDNFGNGIWSDGNLRNVVYEENRVENNTGSGIFHEISWDAVIKNNTLRNNNTAAGGKAQSCWHGGAIDLNNSQNVEIVGNVVEAINANPICLTNSVRSEAPVFPQSLANVNVHGNTLKTRGAVAIGMVGDTVPPGISFTSNTYFMDDLARAVWAYGTFPLTRVQWQAKGQDRAGVFKTW